MSSVFSVIFEEFEQELDAIKILIAHPVEKRSISAKARVAGANAAVLLLAATFEEFVREVAREYAKAVVTGATSHDELPPTLAATVWKRAMQKLARVQLGPQLEILSRESMFSDAKARFSIAFEFCRGDLTQDIYQDLIHNDNNMRPKELNLMFKVSGLENACLLVAEAEDIKSYFGVDTSGLAHGKLLEALNDFFNRRNQTAHSIRAMQSVSPESIAKDLDLLRLFGKSLAELAEAKRPEPATVMAQ